MLRWLLRSIWGPSPGGTTVLFAGLLSGFIFGVAAVGVNERYRIVEVLTFTPSMMKSTAKPVTPPPPGKRWVQAVTTGYCPCPICCENFSANHRTANNRDVNVYPYGYATDKKLLPFRTPLEIPGYGYAEVDDTGKAMRDDAKLGIIHIDLRFTNHPQARSWGKRLVWIAVPEDCGAAQLPQRN